MDLHQAQAERLRNIIAWARPAPADAWFPSASPWAPRAFSAVLDRGSHGGAHAGRRLSVALHADVTARVRMLLVHSIDRTLLAGSHAFPVHASLTPGAALRSA